MKRVLAMCAIGLVLALAPGTQFPVERVAPAIAKLVTTDGASQCTAFLVDARRARWLTVSHCVTADRSGMVIGELPVVEVEFVGDGESALAVVATPLLTNAPEPLRLGDAPARGDRVLNIGFGGNGPVPALFDGLFVAPHVTLADGDMQVWSIQSMPGMSGAPVFDRRARVIGVMAGGIMPALPVQTMVTYGPPFEALRAVFAKYTK